VGDIAEYSFQDRLGLSTGVSESVPVSRILLSAIPGAVSVEKADLGDDKNGVDYWVYRERARPVAVDIKVRETDPLAEWNKDDLALEIWGNVKERRIGWTADTSKETDYVLWYFESTRRWVMMPFIPLCAVFRDNLATWQAEYKVATQSSGSWKSQCVFVPRQEIWSAIIDRYSY